MNMIEYANMHSNPSYNLNVDVYSLFPMYPCPNTGSKHMCVHFGFGF